MAELQEPSSGPDQVLPATSLKCWTASAAVELQMTDTGVAADPPVSVYTFFRRVAEEHPSQRAMAVKTDGQWIYWNYEEYFTECRTVAKAFIKLGLERFHGVCIMGFNSPEWLIANFGSIFAGGMSAGIYTTNSPDACRHLADDCKAQIIVLENEKYLQKILSVKDSLPHIKAIIQWSGTPTTDGVLSWQELLAVGRNETDDALEERLRLQAVNQCCTIIYTSGTTGPPKGVMCSQDSMTWCGVQYGKVLQIKTCHETVVSYLPMSHLAAQMTEIYVSLPMASTIYFAQPDALKGSLGHTLKEIQPTGFLGVPRVWEKIYEKMQEMGSKAGAPTRALGGWAKYHGGLRYKALLEGQQLGVLERLQGSVSKMLVLNRIKAALGLSNATNLISSSAPLGEEILHYFLSLDLPIVEGYGLSESLSVGTLGRMEEGGFRLGSVGKVLPMTNLKLQDSPMASEERPGEGEIMLKGRNIFMGYLNLQDKTDETIQDDGWMLTGDLGWLDSDGFLYISGRVKELVITAGGENIPPVVIEEAIKKQLPILANAMLIGDRRKFLSILLTIKCDFDDVTGMPLDALAAPVLAWCSERGVKAATVTEFRREVDTNRDGVIGQAVQAAINRYNTDLAISNAQKVQRWTILPHDFSLATGELNNTLKLKRSVAATMFADIVDQMYSDKYPVFTTKS